jgi:acetyl-CoA acetyltransferase
MSRSTGSALLASAFIRSAATPASPGSKWRRRRAPRSPTPCVAWEDVDLAVGGSDAAGNADTTVSILGLTGVPFINVKNGCATGGSALTTAHAMLESASANLALVVGSTSIRSVPSTRCPRGGASAPGTARLASCSPHSFSR